MGQEEEIDNSRLTTQDSRSMRPWTVNNK